MSPKPSKIKRYKVDVREPYMGNMVPLIIDVVMDEDGYILGVKVTTVEGITTEAKYLHDKDVQ